MPIVSQAQSGGAYGIYSESIGGGKFAKRSVSIGNVHPSDMAVDTYNQNIYDIVVALNACIDLAATGIERRSTVRLYNET